METLPTVRAIRPEQQVPTRQGLPYFLGVSGRTAGARGLSMHMVVIPPGARAEPRMRTAATRPRSTCSRAASRRAGAQASRPRW